jgi:hypothetical protein
MVQFNCAFVGHEIENVLVNFSVCASTRRHHPPEITTAPLASTIGNRKDFSAGPAPDMKLMTDVAFTTPNDRPCTADTERKLRIPGDEARVV